MARPYVCGAKGERNPFGEDEKSNRPNIGTTARRVFGRRNFGKIIKYSGKRRRVDMSRDEGRGGRGGLLYSIILF